MRRALIALFLALCVGPAAADPPRRVVSFNQCGDQLVLALADPAQIAGLSPYAADPIALGRGREGEGISAARLAGRIDHRAQPDLVLIGQNDRPVTKHILRAQGLRLYEIALISDLDAARRQIIEVAAVLGHPERGEKLLAELDAARARLHAAPKPPFAVRAAGQPRRLHGGRRKVSRPRCSPKPGSSRLPARRRATAATCRSKSS